MIPRQMQMVLRKLEALETSNKTMSTELRNLHEYTTLQAKRIETLGDENSRLRDRVEQAEMMTTRLIRVKGK